MEEFSGIEIDGKPAPKSYKLYYLVKLRHKGKGLAHAEAKKKKFRRIIRRVSEKNRVSFRKLTAGNYEVKYCVNIKKGARRVVGRTSWSSSRSFTIER